MEGPVFGDELDVYDEVENGYSFVKWGIGTFWLKDEFVPIDEEENNSADQEKKKDFITV